MITSNWSSSTSPARGILARVLAASIFTAVAALGQPCAPRNSALSAWFTFDEPLFAKAKRVPGISGSALHFDGTASYFEFPAKTEGFKVGDKDFTVELWLRTTETRRTRNVVEFRNDLPKGYLIFVRAGRIGFQVADGDLLSNSIAENYPIADNRWHHVAGVVKRLPPQAPQIYIDGQPRAQNGSNVTLSNLDHDAPLWLARHRRNGYVPRDNAYFAGDVDELSVYRRALTGTEIRSLYAAGSKGKCRK